MPVDNLYPTPLYYSSVDNYSEIKEEISNLLLDIDFKTNPEWGNNHQLSDTNFKLNFLESSDLLRTEVHRHIGNFLQEIKFQTSLEYNGKVEYAIPSSWVAKYDRGEYAHVHSHAHHELSGVYYHDVKGDHGKFFIECPVGPMSSSFLLNHKSLSTKITPQPGMILLFPGYLRHGVYANETDNSRISVSFNVSFKKPYF